MLESDCRASDTLGIQISHTAVVKSTDFGVSQNSSTTYCRIMAMYLTYLCLFPSL